MIFSAFQSKFSFHSGKLFFVFFYYAIDYRSYFVYSVLFIDNIPLHNLFYYVPRIFLFPINFFCSLEEFLWSFCSLICVFHSIIFAIYCF